MYQMETEEAGSAGRRIGSMSQKNRDGEQGNGKILFSPEQEQRIAGFLQKVKFRKRVFGGVSEEDVWKKIGELNEMYRQALLAERARYDTLLAERDRKKAGE